MANEKCEKRAPDDDLIFVDAVFGVSPQKECLQEQNISNNSDKRKHAQNVASFLAYSPLTLKTTNCGSFFLKLFFCLFPFVWSVITVSYFRHLQYVIVETILCVCLASGGEQKRRFYGYSCHFKHKLPADSPFSYMISALYKFEAINWIEALQWHNNTDCDWREKLPQIAVPVTLLLSLAHIRSIMIKSKNINYIWWHANT